MSHPNRGQRSAASNPTPAQIRAVREAAGLDDVAAAVLVHATQTQWRRFEAGELRMHASMWELFVRKLAELSVRPG